MSDSSESDPASLLDEVRRRHGIAKHVRHYKARTSKLERHREAIVKLVRAGASNAEIQTYLRSMAKPALDIHHTTLLRYIRTLPVERP